FFGKAGLEGTHEGDISQIAAFDDFACLLEEGAGALHGARLNHALVLARGLHHLHALLDIYARGLFDIDILAVLAGLHGHIRVPVIGSADAYGIDGRIGHDFAKVLDSLDVAKPETAGLRLGLFQVGLPDVAYMRDLEAGCVGAVADVARPHRAHA